MADELEKGRLPDCVNQDTFEEVADGPESAGGLAMRWRGKPFGDLPRHEQTLIMSCISGNRREIEAQVKSLRTNNLLTAHERLDRMNPKLRKMGDLVDMAIQDAVELCQNDDPTPCYPGQINFKTRTGTATRVLRHLDRLNRVVKGYVEINATIAKLEEKTSGSVFIKGGDTKTVNMGQVTPDVVAETLGRIVEGETVGDLGEPDK